MLQHEWEYNETRGAYECTHCGELTHTPYAGNCDPKKIAAIIQDIRLLQLEVMDAFKQTKGK